MKSQKRAMILVAIVAVFALPIYLIIAVITVPIGIGVLMLMNNRPWVMNLYPFLFAAKGHWSAPTNYLQPAVSLPLTIVQWTLIAWLSGLLLRNLKPRLMFFGVLAVVFFVGLLTSALLSVSGIELMGGTAHT